MSCASRPCLHNSTCENLVDSNAYRCHCPNGYTGRNCEVGKNDFMYLLIRPSFFFIKEMVTACERTPCLHGQCLKIDLYTEVCICETNWIGVDCSEAVSSEIGMDYGHSNSCVF